MQEEALRAGTSMEFWENNPISDLLVRSGELGLGVGRCSEAQGDAALWDSLHKSLEVMHAARQVILYRGCSLVTVSMRTPT